ncbi:MAG: hypothetical protein ACR2PT_02785 [Endozoicomonas sp.]
MKLNAFKGIGTKFSAATQALKAKLPGKHRHHEVLPSEGKPQEALRGSSQSKDGSILDQRHIETTSAQPQLTTPSKSDKTAQTAPVEPEADLQIQPEATPDNKDSNKVKFLAAFLKQLIGLNSQALDNKEEIQALRKKEQAVKSASKEAVKKLSSAEGRLKSLQKEMSSLLEKKNRAINQKNSKQVLKLGAEISQLEETLQQQSDTVARLKTTAHFQQQQLEQATHAKHEAQDNGTGMLRFGVVFATSLRQLYKAQNDPSTKVGQDRDKTVSFSQPRIVIGLKDGMRVEIKNLQLTMKTVDFRMSDGKQIPVLGLEHLKGDVWVHTPGGECLKVGIELKDVEVEIDTGLGKALHSYVTAPSSVKALAKLLSGGVKALGQLKPRLISVKGNQAGVRLDDCRASTLTALIKQRKPTPDSIAEKIFKALGFNISGELQQFSLDVTGDIGVSASASKLALDYQPETGEEKAKGTTRRRVEVSVGSGAVTAKHGLPMVQQVLSAISPDPKKPTPDGKGSPLTLVTSLPHDTSEEAYASVKKLELQFNRTLTQQENKKKEACRCKDNFGIEASELTARNTGRLGLSATVHGLNATAGTVYNDFGPETVTRESLNASLDLSSAAVTVDAPEGLLPEEVMEQQLTLTGQARVSTGRTHVELESSSEHQHLNVVTPDLRADVRMPVNARLGQHGVHLPRGMELKASGIVDVDSRGSVVEITPSLSLKSTDKMYAILGGARLPVDLKAQVTLDKASPKLFFNKDPQSKHSTITSVMSSGRLKLDAPKLGPVHVDEMSLNLSDADNGELKAKGIEVDFDALSSREKQADTEGFKLPWLPRMLLKHKKLTLSLTSPVKDGVLKLDAFRSVTPRFVSTGSAGFFDRLTTRLLNLGAGLILPKVQQFKVSFGEVGDNGLPLDSSPPILNLKVGPVRKSIPLTGLDGTIGSDGNSIPVAELLRKKAGMVLVRKNDVEQVEKSLEEVRSGKAQGLLRLVKMVLAAQRHPVQSGLIHLIARQLPISECKEILAQDQSARMKLAEPLKTCSAVFSSVPGLETEARQLLKLAG